MCRNCLHSKLSISVDGQKRRHMRWKAISMEDQRMILDNIGTKLGIKVWEDWYRTTEQDIIDQVR